MGLDMYLVKKDNFKSIEWLTPQEEEKENKYDKRIVVTSTDGTKRTAYAFTIRNIETTQGETIHVWELEQITSNGIVIKVYNEDADNESERILRMVIPFSDIKTISYEYAYWRKANQIHDWFVRTVQDGVDDCGGYDVTYEQLEDLKDLCRQVLGKKGNTEFADATLPTCAGFFFGGTEYDDDYYEDLQNTLDQLSEIKEGQLFTYCSSW